MAGKLEIGMSKAVCKEIVGGGVVMDKTATTETWKILSYSTTGVTSVRYLLYFEGDKLVRIITK